MDTSSFVSRIHVAVGVLMTWDIYSLCTLVGALSIKYGLNNVAYFDFVADYVADFITNVQLS